MSTTTHLHNPSFDAPIGVFDSGIGGLSVLQALRQELPHERFVYLADSGNAPYGERGDAFVIARTQAITAHLVQHHGIKALVIACNTATAAAVELLRPQFPHLPVIGVEPALKPASLSSQTHHVGVIATRGTVTSPRFARLLEQHSAHTEFHVQACDGLARAIELSTEHATTAEAEDNSVTEVQTLCAQYTAALGNFGVTTGAIDTLVLGCTHYVFAKQELRALVGPDVHLIDTGAAVARQTRRLLAQGGTLSPQDDSPASPALAAPDHIQLMTTGRLSALQSAAQHWLDLPADCCSAVHVAHELPA